MRRASLVLVALVALAGCKSGSNSVVDPFVGRTTVEPPRTGWIQGQPAADPYYPNQPQTATQAATPTQTAAAAGPAGTSATNTGWVSTDGGSPVPSGAPERASIFEANRSASTVRIPPPSTVVSTPATRYPDVSVAGPAPATAPITTPAPRTIAGNDPATVAAATSSAVATAQWPPSGEGVIRIVEPRGKASDLAVAAPLAADEPRPIDPTSAATARPIAQTAPSQAVPAATQSSGESINIVDLPQARTVVPSGQTTSSTESNAIRLVSATTDVDTAAQPAASFSNRARYGYDPNYGWLRGQLEYSQIERRWKLRYIPIDGTTDQFGGSVVLSDATLLSGYERGHFVEVHGGIGQKSKDDQAYSPVYNVTSIKRL